ncbi:MAG: hypothetical protein ACHQ2Y_10570, partial [Candidatus Lutacidiplasmatales archaeon]
MRTGLLLLATVTLALPFAALLHALPAGHRLAGGSLEPAGPMGAPTATPTVIPAASWPSSTT